MQDLSEEKLWSLCLEGNREAFKEIYCRFYPLLYHYGLKWVLDEELVKDCIQDLFIKLMQRHTMLSPAVYVKGYLIRALRNQLIDLLEKEKGKDCIDAYEEQFSVENLFIEKMNHSLDTTVLKQAFSALPSNQQEILYLYFVDELKHEDIAELKGIRYQSSKNLLFRSLSKLKEIYFEKSVFLKKK